jgi:hypothetical protein
MTKRQEKLNEFDKRVLIEMSDERVQRIAAMAAEADSALTPAQVRRSYRKLRRMGLAVYGPCYDEDEYKVCGSGYSLTDTGVEERDRLRKERDLD